jgi:membrane glycosyltransferase
MSKIDEEELIQGLRKDLEKILEEFNCMPDNISKDIEDEKCGRVRRIMRQAFSSTIQTYRLYFIVRSVFLSLFSSIPFFVVVLILGSINVVQTIILGIFVFVFSLAVTRLFETPIIKLVQKIVIILQRHKRARDFILKNA